MTDESAKALAAAMDRLAAAIERVTGASLGGGINVYHQGMGMSLQDFQKGWPPNTPKDPTNG